MLSLLKTNFKIVFFLGLSVFLISALGYAKSNVLYKGRINTFKLNIRSAPSQNADVVIVVEKGEKVDVIDKQGGVGGWLTVVYKGKKGYVRNRPRYITLSSKLSAEKANKIVEIKEKIQTQEKLVQTFSQKEREIIEGLNEIDFTLNRVRLKAAGLASEVSALEEKIVRLNQDKARLIRTIEENHQYVGKRLKALYKMNMIGRLDVAGMPTSVFDFFLQQNSMKRVIQADFQMIEKQKADYESFGKIETDLQKQIKSKTLLEAELNDQIRITKKETIRRELILKDIRQKKRLSMAAVEALKDAQIRLDNQITDLQASDSGPGQDLSFPRYKGLLKIPVQGEIISRFGPSKTGDDKAFTFQKGIDIKVERGEPVKSVFKGEVKFAQWLKGYGNLLIIDHGDNYYTLYAHVEEIFKHKGETVETGEVIATAGDTGSIKGMCLHFELRHHGKPVNPLHWLRKGAET